MVQGNRAIADPGTKIITVNNLPHVYTNKKYLKCILVNIGNWSIKKIAYSNIDESILCI